MPEVWQPSQNKEVARVLESIANLLEIKGDSAFRVRAYRDAARHIEGMAEDIGGYREDGRLQEIPGVGPSIAAKIDEYLRDGRLLYLEQLKEEVAPGLGQLLEVPGLGPRRAKLVHEALGISTVAELEQAAAEQRLRAIPGIRAKTEENILREVRRFQQRTRRLLLGVAWPAAEQVVALLRKHPEVMRAEAAGSIRRRAATIGDVDIIAASDHPGEVMKHFTTLPMVKEVLLAGATKTSVLIHGNLQVDLRVIRPLEWGAGLQYFTGSKAHNIAVRDIAIRKGLKLSEYGLFDASTGKRVGGENEEEVYRLLGLAWIPPELREDRGEIEAARRGQLPRLLEEGDIRGDLHVHTDWTDGTASVEAMVEAARQRGYEYVAITDHSLGLGVARGLTVERLKEQRRLIDDLNGRLAPFRILRGIELEIKADGSLDYDENVLAQFDIVTASIHSSFKQTVERMTERIMRAVRSPYVHVLSHPKGRLIDKRPGYEVDMEAVIRAATEEGTALEINGQPDRLDLDEVWARRAKERGAMLAVNSDAHGVDNLVFMRYGVATARRAWIEAPEVLNAMPLDKLLRRLHPAREAA